MWELKQLVGYRSEPESAPENESSAVRIMTNGFRFPLAPTDRKVRMTESEDRLNILNWTYLEFPSPISPLRGQDVDISEDSGQHWSERWQP